MLLLNLRLSLWVAAGIPVAFALAGLLVWSAGHSLNMINLFGLILVLGIVVDRKPRYLAQALLWMRSLRTLGGREMGRAAVLACVLPGVPGAFKSRLAGMGATDGFVATDAAGGFDALNGSR